MQAGFLKNNETFKQWANTVPWNEPSQCLAEINLLCSALIENDESSANPLNELPHVLKQLSEALPENSLALAQLNLTPGDIEGNACKIMRCIELAETLKLDAILFPELALMGYPIDDVVLKHPHIVDENMRWLEAIAEKTGNTKALVGFAEPRPSINKKGEHRVGKPFYNSAAILANGKIEGVVRKALLPNYAEFNDYRIFEPSKTFGVIPAKYVGQDALNEESTDTQCLDINGIQYGISICEDLWNNDVFLTHRLYHEQPLEALSEAGAQVMLNLSASPSRAQKEPLKHKLLAHTAKRVKAPVVYVNHCGSVDGLNYDGTSRVYGKDGTLIARGKAFECQFIITSPLKAVGHIEPLPNGLDVSELEPTSFDVTHKADLARTYQAITQGIRDYFAKSGFKRATLGLSGGLDSSVTAVLLADALGAENVIGISMPSSITPGENKSDAQTLAENLGMVFLELPIIEQLKATENFADSIETSISGQLGKAYERSTGKDNVQAMMRALNLRRIGNDYHALPIATSDKSEMYVGYATVNGDMSGALAPIGDVLKTKVRALAHWLNANRAEKNAIPLRVIEKPSGADLKINPKTGMLVTAEEDLMPYPFLDEIIWLLEYHHADCESLMATSLQYEQMLESQGTPLPQSQKQEWIEKFYRLMNAAVFKWHIAPPVLVVDGYGITRSEYRRPIISKVHSKQSSLNAIKKSLDEASLHLATTAP